MVTRFEPLGPRFGHRPPIRGKARSSGRVETTGRRDVTTGDLVALYAAALSTLLALGQAVNSWRQRSRITVSATMAYAPSGTYGTPVRVQRGKDLLDEVVSVSITIRNIGGVPVQVLGVLLEDLVADRLNVVQITPHGLPVVLDPGTTTMVQLEKEHLDDLAACTFIGVVDGTGHRHSVVNPRSLIEDSWRLPTRLAVYQRRDEPADRVVAFQVADPAILTTRPARRGLRRKAKPIVARPRSLIDTLAEGDQPRSPGLVVRSAGSGKAVGPAA